MAFKLGDRVRETSTTTGTGTIMLAGAVTGFRAFSTLLSTGDTTWYSIVAGAQWETGIGTFGAGNMLERTTVLESSSGGSAVNFAVGAKDVFLSYPASQVPDLRRNVPNGFAGLGADGKLLASMATTNVVTQVFTSSGTFTKEADDIAYWIECIGGGGAGGASNSASGAGGGGCGGVSVRRLVPASDVGASVSVTIGSGGAGISNANGGSGGSSSFGTLVTAMGGEGGERQTVSTALPSGSGYGVSGRSFSTDFGAGGAGGAVSGAPGSHTVFGGGGGGGGSSTSGGANASAGTSQYGGAGGAGATSGNLGGSTAGSAPGGGGGAYGVSTGKAGARGEVRIWRFKK